MHEDDKSEASWGNSVRPCLGQGKEKKKRKKKHSRSGKNAQCSTIFYLLLSHDNWTVSLGSQKSGLAQLFALLWNSQAHI